MSRVETAEGVPFSEPPQVTVKVDRTHCEACKEPLDPNVMHKCEGNKEWEPVDLNKVDWMSTQPDLAKYKGACPIPHVEGKVCVFCNGTGVIE